MRLLLVTTALALAFLPAETALAKKNKAKHGGKGVVAELNGCPPGLAKKNNGCRPPGKLKRKVRQGSAGDSAVHRSDKTQPQLNVIQNEAGEAKSRSLGPQVTQRNAVSAKMPDFVTLVSGERLAVGSRLEPGYRQQFRVIDNPGLFGLAPNVGNRSYLRIGETAVQVDDDTREVVSLTALTGVLIK